MTQSIRSRAWQALAATGLGLALVTTGCGDDPPEPSRLDGNENKPSTPVTAAPTIRPTPTPTPSSTVTFDSQREQEIYDATVHFYNTINQAYKTLDTEPIEDLVVPGSGAGVRYIEYIESVKSKGHRFEKAPQLTVVDFTIERRDADENSDGATFTLFSAGTKEVDSTGRVINEFEPGSAKRTIQFQKVEGKWLVLSQR